MLIVASLARNSKMWIKYTLPSAQPTWKSCCVRPENLCNKSACVVMAEPNPLDEDTLLREIRAYLPTPVREEMQLDGSMVLVGGDPGEVVVRIRGSKVAVAVFAVVWNGPYTPVVRPKFIGNLNWKRLPASGLMMGLHNLIESARELRHAKYGKCERCGETKPPEWMHDDKTCQSCAERYLGVVH